MIDTDIPFSLDDLEQLLEATATVGLVFSELTDVGGEGQQEIMLHGAEVCTVLLAASDQDPAVAAQTVDFHALDGPSN